KRAPEAPHRWMRGFLVGRMTECMRVNVTRVHPFVEQIDGLAFAGSVSSAHDDNNRRARRPEKLVLSFEQRLAKLGLFALVATLVERVTKLRGFEHGMSLLCDGP